MDQKVDARLIHVPFLPIEWETVKRAFLNRTRDACSDALDILTSWRMRSSVSLSFAVQASELLVHAVLNDSILLGDDQKKQVHSEEENLRLIYGMTITRFINYVAESAVERGTTISDACKKYNIPPWVVEIRHAATHGKLPALTVLRDCIEFCWNWILERYWEKKPLFIRSDDNNRKLSQTEEQPNNEGYAPLEVYGNWAVADDSIDWSKLPIGLGPGQNVENLTLRLHTAESCSGETDKNSKETNCADTGNQTAPTQEWSDEKRLDLIDCLVKMVRE